MKDKQKEKKTEKSKLVLSKTKLNFRAWLSYLYAVSVHLTAHRAFLCLGD